MGNAESSQDHGPDGRQFHDELKLGWCNEAREHKRDLRTVSAVPVVQTGENTTRPIDRDREEAMERVRRQGERNTSFASGQSQILGKHSYYPDTISAPVPPQVYGLSQNYVRFEDGQQQMQSPKHQQPLPPPAKSLKPAVRNAPLSATSTYATPMHAANPGIITQGPHVSQYTGQEVAMTLPAKEYGMGNTFITRNDGDQPTRVLPAIDYAEYKARGQHGQLPELGKYVPTGPSRIEEAYAAFVESDESHIAYVRAPNDRPRHTVISSSNGNAMQMTGGRPENSPLNHRILPFQG